jgi:hypothetical protein
VNLQTEKGEGKMKPAEREKAWKMILALIDGERGSGLVRADREGRTDDLCLMFQAVKDAGTVPEQVMFWPLDFWGSWGGKNGKRSLVKKLREHGNVEMAALLSKDPEKYEAVSMESRKAYHEYLGEYEIPTPRFVMIRGHYTLVDTSSPEVRIL